MEDQTRSRDRISELQARRRFAATLTLAFVLVAGFQIFHHVMWFDEWQAWLIARDADSIRGLFHNLHYETHPALWYLCLYAITRVTGNFHAMQIFHLCVAAAGVFVVAARSPLSRLQATLHAFGFFVAYEYCVISRSYVLGLFLMLLALTAMRRGPGRLGFYLLLALLAQVDAFSIAIAAALAAADLTRVSMSILNRSSQPRPRLGMLLAGLLVFCVSCVLAYLQILAPSDCTYANLHGTRDLTASIGGLYAVWLPLPEFGPHFWNTNILDGLFPWIGIFEAFYSVLLLVIALRFFSNSSEAIVLLIVGAIAITVELYLSRQVAFRHAGHLFLLLIAAYWIAGDLGGAPHKYDVARRRFFTVILIAQLIPSAWAFYVERTLPFSESKAVADYIKSHFPPDIPVVVGDDMSGPALSGYLGRPVYFESRRAYGTYLVWDSRRRLVMDPFPALVDFQSVCKRDVIFLLPPHWLDMNRIPPPPQLHLLVLGEYDRLIYQRDQYEVVLAKYVPTGEHPQ